MDPVIATGLAASIVTFVQFTWNICAQSRAIYRSANGLPKDKASIDAVAVDLGRLSRGISIDSTESTSQDLKELATACTTIADELCSALGDLKRNGRRTRWSSLQTALKDVWGARKIEDLQRRLNNVREQLHIRLTAEIRFDLIRLARLPLLLMVPAPALSPTSFPLSTEKCSLICSSRSKNLNRRSLRLSKDWTSK